MQTTKVQSSDSNMGLILQPIVANFSSSQVGEKDESSDLYDFMTLFLLENARELNLDGKNLNSFILEHNYH